MAQGRSSFLHASKEDVAGENTVEVEFLRGVRARVDCVKVQISTTNDVVARRRLFQDVGMAFPGR